MELSKNAYEGIGPLIIGAEDNRKIYAMVDYDPGFPILISVLGFLGIEFHDLSDFKVINCVLLWFGLLFFSLLFIRKRPLVFLTTQILILVYFFTIGARYSSFTVDFHSSVIPLTIFTFSLVESFFNNKTRWQYLKIFVLFILGAVFGMFRNYFTYIFFFLMCLISVNILKLKSKERNIYLRFIFLLLAILILLNFSNLVQRGFYSYTQFKNPDLSLSSDLPPPYSHGVYHVAYIGLGYFKNKWGIQWDDAVGFRHAKHYDPTVKLLTPRYFSIVKKLYFKYLMENPIEYIKNHIKKMFIVMKDRVDRGNFTHSPSQNRA